MTRRAAGRYAQSIDEWRKRIYIDPEIRSGQPCIVGTRMTVHDILEYLAGGMSPEEVLDDFPHLTPEDLRAAFGFAAHATEVTRAIEV